MSDSRNSFWNFEGLDEDRFFAVSYYLYIFQRQQSRAPPPDEQPKSDLYLRDFLDRLALLFARKKKKDTERHVTATGLIGPDGLFTGEGGTLDWTKVVPGTVLTIYLAKNNGLEKRDLEFKERLEEWFKMSDVDDDSQQTAALEGQILHFWEERLHFYFAQIRNRVNSLAERMGKFLDDPDDEDARNQTFVLLQMLRLCSEGKNRSLMESFNVLHSKALAISKNLKENKKRQSFRQFQEDQFEVPEIDLDLIAEHYLPEHSKKVAGSRFDRDFRQAQEDRDHQDHSNYIHDLFNLALETIENSRDKNAFQSPPASTKKGSLMDIFLKCQKWRQTLHNHPFRNGGRYRMMGSDLTKLDHYLQMLDMPRSIIDTLKKFKELIRKSGAVVTLEAIPHPEPRLMMATTLYKTLRLLMAPTNNNSHFPQLSSPVVSTSPLDYDSNFDDLKRRLKNPDASYTRYVHCEIQMLNHLSTWSKSQSPANSAAYAITRQRSSPHIGVSKLSCETCYQVFKKQKYYKTTASHHKISPNCDFPSAPSPQIHLQTAIRELQASWIGKVVKPLPLVSSVVPAYAPGLSKHTDLNDTSPKRSHLWPIDLESIVIEDIQALASASGQFQRPTSSTSQENDEGWEPELEPDPKEEHWYVDVMEL